MNPIKGTRREILQGLAAGGLAAAAAPASAIAKERKPNIVFFLGEGLRWDEFGFMGNDILKTPHMDKMAKEGTHVTNAFVTTSLCSPSRASILTGQFSHRHQAMCNQSIITELHMSAALR